MIMPHSPTHHPTRARERVMPGDFKQPDARIDSIVRFGQISRRIVGGTKHDVASQSQRPLSAARKLAAPAGESRRVEWKFSVMDVHPNDMQYLM